jgi:hypothetical protein
VNTRSDIEIRWPDGTDAMDVVKVLGELIANLICSMAPTKIEAQKGALAFSTDFVRIVGETWDENGHSAAEVH